MIMERKPLVVVPGLVRRDAIAYLQEHVDVRQWTEKTKMPREVLKNGYAMLMVCGLLIPYRLMRTL